MDRLGRRDVLGRLPRPGPVNSELSQQGALEHGFNHVPRAVSAQPQGKKELNEFLLPLLI